MFDLTSKSQSKNVLQIVQLIDIQISAVMGFFQNLVKFDTLLRMLLFFVFSWCWSHLIQKYYQHLFNII